MDEFRNSDFFEKKKMINNIRKGNIIKIMIKDRGMTLKISNLKRFDKKRNYKTFTLNKNKYYFCLVLDKYKKSYSSGSHPPNNTIITCYHILIEDKIVFVDDYNLKMFDLEILKDEEEKL